MSATCLQYHSFSAEQALKENFAKEASSHWEEYSQLLTDNLSVRVTAKIINRNDNDAIAHNSVSELVLSSPFFSYTVTSQQEDSKKVQASVANSRYSFTVVNKNGEEWTIQDLTVNQSTNAESLVDKPEKARALRSVAKGLLIETTWLPEMVQHPHFQVRDASSVVEDGSDLIKVDFYYPGENKSDVVRVGYMILDPERYWLIQKAEVSARWVDAKGTISIENTISDDQVSFPVVARHEKRVRAGTPEEETALDTVLTLDWRSLQSEPSPAEFTLSAYGHPEPRIPYTGPSLVFWLTIVACILLFLAVVGKWYLVKNRT